jgi:DNA-binding PadR family transcriptional regulator
VAAKKQSKGKTGGNVTEKKPLKTAEQKRAEKQALALWALLGEGGEGYGGQLKPEIKKPERDALQREGLIETTKHKGGALWLTITDKGWDWAEQHLADPLPEKTFGGAFVLRAWLSRLKQYLLTEDIRLAEIITTRTAPGGGSLKYDHAALRERVREAYYDVAGGFNRRVLLRDLRPKLADIDREQVDATLMQMLRDDEISLMQLDYRPDVTDEDRAASLQIGNEPRHIVWIAK